MWVFCKTFLIGNPPLYLRDRHHATPVRQPNHTYTTTYTNTPKYWITAHVVADPEQYVVGRRKRTFYLFVLYIIIIIIINISRVRFPSLYTATPLIYIPHRRPRR
jgi:hypothetical protein